MKWLAYASAAVSALLFIGASLTWWPPYLFGKAFKFAAMGEDWNELHARTFAKTLIILPDYKGRPRPNLEHNILHVVMLAAAIVTALSAKHSFAPRRPALLCSAQSCTHSAAENVPVSGVLTPSGSKMRS